MNSIKDYGASPTSATNQAGAIQAAIDAAATGGGGVVVVPPGLYRTGTLVLKDHVTLHLENGACLLGVESLADYPEIGVGFTDAIGQKRGRCLIFAANRTGVAVTGQGTIDGNGAAFGYCSDNRPFLMRFADCSDVQVTGVTLRNSAGWVSHFLGCSKVLAQGITIRSAVNGNNDGIDVDSCSRVRIAGCDIDTGDDAVCIKTTRSTPCDNIVVTGCVLKSVWAAMKLGTESAGDFRNIIFSDCIIRDTMGGGVKVISMDGCRMDNIQVNNIIMDNVSGPIFVRLGSRLRKYYEGQPDRDTGTIRNLSIRNVTGRVWEEGAPLYGKYPRKAGIIVSGVPNHAIESLAVENVDLVFPGGGTALDDARGVVPEQEREYPEFPVFHPIPSWGFYLRHVRRIKMRDVCCRTEQVDARAAIYADDVHDLGLDNVRMNGAVHDRSVVAGPRPMTDEG